MKFSSTQIEISGLNLERKLNFLNKNNIKILKVDRVSRKKCLIVVPHTNKQQAIAILSEKCYNEEGKETTIPPPSTDFGIARLFGFCKNHIAIALCIVLIMPLLLVSSFFCLKIEVSGDISKQTVVEALDEFGVSLGKNLLSLDTKSLENFLCERLHVSYASVLKKGSVLFVKTVKSIYFDGIVDLNSPRDIVSNFDGIVERMLVIQGNPLVEVGDTVKKGQVLIEGKRLFSDGTTEDVCALGEVFATVSVSATEIFNSTATIFSRTGNSICRTIVKIAKASSTSKTIPFEYFEIEEQQTTLFPLNITIVFEKVFELQKSTVSVEFDAVVESMKQKALEKATELAFFVPNATRYTVVDGQSVTVTLLGTINITANNS